MSTPEQQVYRGAIYIRPCDRGIVLEDDPRERYLDEWVEAAVREAVSGRPHRDGRAERVEITVRVLPDGAPAAQESEG